mmetsp:Transcript_63370/g.125298  ORF Transcript_63370/g.125298 Transcript_63370/m.125298 type:complete len:87 (-) Transcript_63370:452-712(-)|eukprot:CAMPEP_0174721864 /NCGR_PEP_ID=MMETSP1094-20130205/37351_1 /TAXON_ID=156173 /ORGANISM="Chrysochromulina brevifilum, Strain UTEX LB 985" /LENGTH=86 /DNA_ID=CAMNT_0015922629 /DNA_START=16 /DNA_END=276 /DNA_ORIENTATION=+
MLADMKAQKIGNPHLQARKGSKVIHTVEAIDSVTYSITAQMESHMAQRAHIADLFILGVAKYSQPNSTFELLAPAIICDGAAGDFT